VSPSPLPRARLAAIASELAGSPHRWRGLVRHDPHQRAFTRLRDDGDLEVWILGWELDQGIELHDHGGASGAFAVVEGELLESHTDLDDRRPVASRTWKPGETCSFGPAHVHDLVNRGPTLATSVHVYSPRLSTMTFYDHRPASFLLPLWTERSETGAVLVG